MSSLRYLFIALIAWSLGGCATPRPETLSLQEISGGASFDLAKAKSWKTGPAGVQGALRGSLEIALLPGKYIAERKNSLGTYFLGQNLAIWEHVDNSALRSKFILRRGGIWVPSNPQDAPRLYIYYGGFVPTDVSLELIAEQTKDAGKTSNADIATNPALHQMALNSLPHGTSPAVTGVASGLAVGLVAILAEAGGREPHLLPWSLSDVEFIGDIRSTLEKTQDNIVNKK